MNGHARRNATASSSRTPFDDGLESVASSTAPQPTRITIRASKSTLPNGHSGKGKGKATPHSAPNQVIRDTLCSFCAGTDDRNRHGQEEWMVSCSRCGRSGHPSCLDMRDPGLKEKVMTYNWCCIECKMCEICMVKGDDVSCSNAG